MIAAKHTIPFLTLLFFLVSCGGEKQERLIPSYVLDKEIFTQLLTDMALAESAANINIKNLAGKKFDSAYAFDPVKERKIERKAYDSTLAFYSRDPEKFKEIYEEILVRLSDLKIKREKGVRDTLVK